MREQLLATEQVKAIEWRDGALHLLDQRDLPGQQRWLSCERLEQVLDALRDGVVLGAPLSAVCLAYGLVLALRERVAQGAGWGEAWLQDWQMLVADQPADGSWSWVLKLMRERLERSGPQQAPVLELEAEAAAIHCSLLEGWQSMARSGLRLLRRHQLGEQCLLTHGHASVLAGGGGPLAVLAAAYDDGLLEQVYLEQPQAGSAASRLTAWQLAELAIPQSHYSAAACAQLMKVGSITWVIVGAQRIAANGDLLNTVGTYQLAVNAMHHGVRLMVVAPSTVIDLSLEQGDDAALEDLLEPALSADVTEALAAEAGRFAPQLDVTPADFIDFLVTEKGVVERPDAEKIAQLLCRKRLH
ncbi:s-methyl-5-thioribose-1-phosphate isomerase [Pseudomonas sp. 5P_3.1_Bac2]|uniref:s-methyl-5-thioribose-1-phosphate isomerase n=1 Tax=Pseudomonas sp. 5P_3.1_Bac2 TaxID=2971617 RepID=UPI0021C74863|nr:s-methyl-5-thioribose-1-phosphate isomerase [Pseudomonas sp. 5P_3.1_Bac2]MCU1716528.1 s-methyl-5-thioribose-1-phosphate isomerase [Pseudomonas sp. 5P_3.1_Bac2]